jgi:peptide/nickel transport system ATP-binding protein
MQKLLQIDDLKIYYKSKFGDYKSVDGVTFEVYENEIFGIAGESGCGKSTLVEGILGLVQLPGYIKNGKILFKGKDLLNLKEDELRALRWVDFSYIPQGSMNSLNPVLKIEEQMLDVIFAHVDVPVEKAKDMAISSLRETNLPIKVLDMYSHELSGGMKQRVIIAMSTILKPKLVIADEPVTALDVLVQKLILQSIANLKDSNHMTVILVAHDMAIHAEIVDRLAIMYAGKIMEIGPVHDIFKNAQHPYTKCLIMAIPAINEKNIKSIPGLSPSPLNWPKGCRFHPRCPYAFASCSEIEPTFTEINSNHYAACHLLKE